MTRLLLVCVGAASSFGFSSIGVVFYGEVAMAILAPWYMLHQLRRKDFVSSQSLLLLAALMVTAVGYVVADLVNRTEFENAVRGWGRLLFILTNIVFLYSTCFNRPADLRWFCLGCLAGDLALAIISPDSGYLWKFGYGVPLTLLAVLALSSNWRRCNAAVGAGLLLGLASMHMLLDFRSFSVLCVLLALMFVHVRSNGVAWPQPATLKIAAVMLIGAALVFTLYRDSDQYYDGRRRDSNAYRKSGYVTALAAISQSPFFGSGSWSHNADYQMIFQQTLTDEGARLSARYEAHSQILQAWYEGGLLGTVFLLYLGVQIGRSCSYLVRRRIPDEMTLVYSFFLFISMWDLFMSPFAGSLRLRIAVTATMVLFLRREQIRAKGNALRRILNGRTEPTLVRATA